MLDPHGKNVSLSRMMQQQMMMQPLGEYVASSCALSEFVGACPTSYKWRNFKKHPGSLGKTCICTMDQNWRGMLYLSHQKLQIIYIYSGRKIPALTVLQKGSPSSIFHASDNRIQLSINPRRFYMDSWSIFWISWKEWSRWIAIDVDFFRVFWRYGLDKSPKRQK